MSHSAEHAQRPHTGGPDPTTQRAPQTPPTETPHAYREITERLLHMAAPASQ